MTFIIHLLFSHQSCVLLFAIPWTLAHQAPLPMGFSKQEYWSWLPCPSPGDLPDPEFEPMSPSLAGGFFNTEPPGKPYPSENRKKKNVVL